MSVDLVHIDQTFDQWLDEHEEWRKCSDLIVMPPTAAEVLEEFPDMAGSDIAKESNERAFTTYGVTRLALYLRLRRDQQSHRFAEMVAMQTPPRCMTDDVFFAGLPCFHETMTDSHKQFILKQARSCGFEPPSDAIYQSGLARFPGDPEAFITRSMGRNYIRRLCEKRGWACEGAVNVAAVDKRTEDPLDKEKCIPLADDIVNRRMTQMMERDPSLIHANRVKLRQEIIRKHGPSE